MNHPLTNSHHLLFTAVIIVNFDLILLYSSTDNQLSLAVHCHYSQF